MTDRRLRPLLTVPLALVALSMLVACGESKPPAARLAAEPGRIDLPWPGFAEVDLELEPLAELPAGSEPLLFVHLLDEPGSVVRTFDQPLPAPWSVGRPQSWTVRLYQSALAEPLAPGEYLLSAGLYLADGERFALETDGEAISRLEYRIASVGVPPPGEKMPAARFSEHWLPPQPGVDRQVLARRALRGGAPGTIQFGPIEGSGRLFLGLVVPDGSAERSRLEILDGGSLPKVRIGTSCGGGQPEVTGTGRLDVDLDLPSAGSPRICDVTIEPNFQVTSLDSAEPTSVVLEVLAWGPAADAEAD